MHVVAHEKKLLFFIAIPKRAQRELRWKSKWLSGSYRPSHSKGHEYAALHVFLRKLQQNYFLQELHCTCKHDYMLAKNAFSKINGNFKQNWF